MEWNILACGLEISNYLASRQLEVYQSNRFDTAIPINILSEKFPIEYH